MVLIIAVKRLRGQRDGVAVLWWFHKTCHGGSFKTLEKKY